MSIDFTDSAPLYRQIVRDIEDRIASGALAVGDRIGSHRQLSENYGVSLITVKKALAELVRRGVLYARVGKGTFVARTAPRVDIEKHRSIGIVVRDLTVPFFSDIVQGVEAHAYEAGYNVLLSVSAGKTEKEERQIEHFRDIGVDGLLIASMDQRHRAPDAVRVLHKSGFPYFMVSYVIDPDIYLVCTDHEQGAFAATDHLVAIGRRRIAYLTDAAPNTLSDLREAGYRRALETAGRAFDDRLVYRLLEHAGWERFDEGYEIGLRLAAEADRPDAFFIYNDIAALGFQRGLLEAGVRVPDDVALVGFDDIDHTHHAPVPLTSIRQSADAISAAAVRRLLKRIAGKPVEPRLVLAPELVVRASTSGVTKPGSVPIFGLPAASPAPSAPRD